MANPRILIVDDQRDVIRLLRSAIESLNHELEIVEAPSGEEAMLEISRRQVDLLVSDYRLPGITGVELMRKVRNRRADAKVILITGLTDERVRRELVQAGANAIFEKPVPMADFLDAVERLLGLVRTIFPAESELDLEIQRENLSSLLGNLRQRAEALAVFLLSDRGRILVRAGELPDSSMEVSLLSALMAIYSAGQKVARFAHQEPATSFHVFKGGDHDLVFIPVDQHHALLMVGYEITESKRLGPLLDTLFSVRGEVDKLLQSLGLAIPERSEEQAIEVQNEPVEAEAEDDTPPAEDIEALFKQSKKKMNPEDVDAFWMDVMSGASSVRTNPEVISYEQAKKLGLAPGDEQ